MQDRCESNGIPTTEVTEHTKGNVKLCELRSRGGHRPELKLRAGNRSRLITPEAKRSGVSRLGIADI